MGTHLAKRSNMKINSSSFGVPPRDAAPRCSRYLCVNWRLT